jgi:hypothetical protein
MWARLSSSSSVKTLWAWCFLAFSIDFINQIFNISNIVFIFHLLEIFSEASIVEGVSDVLLAEWYCIDSSVEIWVILCP